MQNTQMDNLKISFKFLLEYGPLSGWKTLSTAMLVMAMLGVMLILNKSKWTGKEKWLRTAFLFYIYLILTYTLLSRSGRNYFDYNLMPFWSYRKIWMTDNFELAVEVFTNCLMFIPVGILMPLAYENHLGRDQVRIRKTVIIFGFALSALVECLQLMTKTGLFEWDDMIHNTIGVITGYGIYLFIKNKPFREAGWYFLPLGLVIFGLTAAMLSGY